MKPKSGSLSGGCFFHAAPVALSPLMTAVVMRQTDASELAVLTLCSGQESCGSGEAWLG
jgi:hypothetical protein